MDILWDSLMEFVVDYCEYLPPSIPELLKIPTPTEFLNEHVVTNLPFVFRGTEKDHFQAVAKWEDYAYLRKMMREKTVTVAVTPDGRADSIIEDRFMIPEERKMLFDKFFDEFCLPDRNQVFYVQNQNNSLIEEFSPLVQDVASHIPWATEAFGYHPDAANIWMGDSRSVTSVHKDHYENIYYVITGRKTFYLFPPVAVGWMPYKKCKKFQWFYEKQLVRGDWLMKDLNEEVEWIVPSRKPETPEHFTMFNNTKNYRLDVFPGDFLYIPALWFHEVHQSDKCIAVNYWYDMKYDFKYPFFKLLDKLRKLPTSRRNASTDKQPELEESLLEDLHVKYKNCVREGLDRKTYTLKHVHK